MEFVVSKRYLFLWIIVLLLELFRKTLYIMCIYIYIYSPFPSSLGVGLPSFSASHKALVGLRRCSVGRVWWSPGLKEWDMPPSLLLLNPQPCLEPSLRRPVLIATLGCSSVSPWDDALLMGEVDFGEMQGSPSWPAVQKTLITLPVKPC